MEEGHAQEEEEGEGRLLEEEGQEKARKAQIEGQVGQEGQAKPPGYQKVGRAAGHP